MKPKKSNKANLENRRNMHFLMGLLISASLILISFEWTRPVNLERDLAAAPEIIFDYELPEVVPREERKTEIRKQPQIKTVIVPVPDDILLPPMDWDIEVDENTKVDFYIDDEVENLPPEPEYFYFPQERATFRGGSAETEFGKYIYGKLRYPDEAVENGIKGLVVLQFDINPAGELVNAQIIKGVHPSIDNEALRVVRGSPRWIPARQGGKAVTMRFSFPVRFVLQ